MIATVMRTSLSRLVPALILIAGVLVAACGSSEAKQPATARSSTATPTSTPSGSPSRRDLWTLEEDAGASEEACRAQGAIRDPTLTNLCLNRGKALATGED